MTSDRTDDSEVKFEPAQTITRVLGDSEHVQGLVKECYQELSEVNETLQREFAHQATDPKIESALSLSGEVEAKVQEASGKLSLVNHALSVEVRERHELEEQLAEAREEGEASLYASIHDPLTGLPNRVLFIDRLNLGMAQAKRHGAMLAVMFLDLDGFKGINDLYGHAIGDLVLKTVAERLQKATRGGDTASRHGGDEFLYLLSEVNDHASVTTVAAKMRSTICAPSKFDMAGTEVNPAIRVSIGIALYPLNGLSAEDLIDNADQAMYAAKRKKIGFSFSPM